METGWYEVKTIRVKLRCAEEQLQAIKDPESAALIAAEVYKGLDADQEHFVIMALNKANQITGFKLVHSGGIDESLVHPGTVFRYALLMGATGIICVHNHPSGRLEPSPEDLNMTKKLVDAGAMLGIRVIDHLILGNGQAMSFRERGIL